MQGLRQVGGKALAPHIVDGEGRRYARTDERLAVGMSGGPVVDTRSRCVGLFQGILPPPLPPPAKMGVEAAEAAAAEAQADQVDPILRPLQEKGAWELHAAFIPMGRIQRFVAERGLCGASAASEGTR